MKLQNLLIFKDYKVKIGDFGCSIKMSEKEDGDMKYDIKGLTKYFCT